MITLLVITDGRRRCLERTLSSFELCVRSDDIGRRVIVNDCPEDPAFTDWVDTLGFDVHLRPLARRRGFGGAIAAGWAALGDTNWVFHLEDDFVINRHLNLRAMIAVIKANPHLTQMALRRQPWNEQETEAGGIVELHPDAYTDCTDGTHHWLEHRVFFTTNPSLYPAWITNDGWPRVPQSEGIFSHRLFERPELASAFWGRRSDPPWVHHIGEQRTGSGY